jgi:hypothetical protein
MRLRLLVVLVATGLLGGAFCVQACGPSDEVAGGAEGDVPEGGVHESGALDGAEPEPPCDPAGDLFARAHDASIGDGASTTGLCLGCAKARCDEAIAKCTANCQCQGIVGRALDCYVTTQQLGCASALTSYLVTSETRSDALRILGCVQSECPVECVIDAGPDATASDAGAD